MGLSLDSSDERRLERTRELADASRVMKPRSRSMRATPFLIA
jgi:hypothetical protein